MNREENKWKLKRDALEKSQLRDSQNVSNSAIYNKINFSQSTIKEREKEQLQLLVSQRIFSCALPTFFFSFLQNQKCVSESNIRSGHQTQVQPKN